MPSEALIHIMNLVVKRVRSTELVIRGSPELLAKMITESPHVKEYLDKVASGPSTGLQSGDDSARPDPTTLNGFLYFLYKCKAFLTGDKGTSLLKAVLSVFAVFTLVTDPFSFSFTKYEKASESFYSKMSPITSTYDFVRSLIEGVQFLVDSGYALYHNGFEYFNELPSIDERITRVEKIVSEIANLSYFNSTLTELVTEIEDLHSLVSKAMLKQSALSPRSPERVFFCNLKRRLDAVRVDLDLKTQTNGLRKAPYVVLISGNTSVGKSFFVDLTATISFAALGLPMDRNRMYTHSPNDKFWSSYTSDNLFVNFDEVACFLPSVVPGVDPTLEPFLTCCNNIKMTLPMAELNEKGKVLFQPSVITATTNTKDLSARNYFKFATALHRRFGSVITLIPKIEFSTNASVNGPADLRMLDVVKANAAQVPNKFDDLWLIQVQKPIIKSNGDPAYEDVGVFDIHQYSAYLVKEIRENEAQQEYIVQKSLSMSEISMCDTCLRFGTACSCEIQRELQSGFVDDNPTFSLVGGFLVLYSVVITMILFKCYAILQVFQDQLIGVAPQIRGVTSVVDSVLGWHSWLTSPLMIIPYITYPYRYVRARLDSRYARTIALATFNPPPRSVLLVSLGVFCATCFTLLYWLKKMIPESELQFGQSHPMSSENFVKMKAKEPGANVWISRHLPGFEHRIATTNARNHNGPAGISQFNQRIFKNILTFRLRTSETTSSRFNGLGLGANTAIANNHSFPEAASWYLTIVDFSGTFNIKLTEANVTRFPERDIIFLNLTSFRLMTNLGVSADKWHPDKSVFPPAPADPNTVVEGFYHIPKVSEHTIDLDTYPVSTAISDIFQHEDLTHPVPSWTVKSCFPTYRGDCGSVFVSATPYPAISGFHTAGDSNDKSSDKCAIQLDGQMLKTCFEQHIARMKLPSLNFAKACGLQAGLPTTPVRRLPIFAARDDFPVAGFGIAPLHPKSPLNSVEDGPYVVAGSIARDDGEKYFRRDPVTGVCVSPMAGILEPDLGPPTTGPPVLSGYRPKVEALSGMRVTPLNFNEAVVDAASTCFLNKTLRGLGEPDFKLGRLDLYDTVNGIPNVGSVNHMDFRTSAGFPHNTPKGNLVHSTDPRGDHLSAFLPDKVIMDDVELLQSRYISGEKGGAVFTANFKDEPVSFAKQAIAKTRVIFGSTFALSIVIRTYFLPLIVLIQANSILFEAAPGVNATGPEWTDFYHHLTKYGRNKIVAGDFKGWDKSVLNVLIMKSALSLLYTYLMILGSYTPDEEAVIVGSLNDILYSTVDFFGDLALFFGTNPSGHSLTVIVNCFVNSILLRYFFIILYCERVLGIDYEFADPFQIAEGFGVFDKEVSLMTYGDDNIFGVANRFFSHHAISEVASRFGIVYTDPDKTDRVIDFIDISQTTFLQRGFAFYPGSAVVLAPLKRSSIDKSLLTWKSSRNIAQKAHIVDVLRSVHREAAQHPKEVFDFYHDLVRKVMTHFDITSDWIPEASCSREDYLSYVLPVADPPAQV
jgi:hypothetical protein